MSIIWLIFIPLLGGLLCWQSERISRGAPRWIAFFSMVLMGALGLYLLAQGDYSLTPSAAGAASNWQSEYRAPWIPSLGISFHLGLDGLSLSLVLLTAGLGLAAVLCSWREIQRNVGFFYLNLLWNLAGVTGVFLALDLFVFFFFWEVMLVPMYFLIALWGHNAPDGKGRIHAANKFFIFTQASGLLLLIAIIGLVIVSQQQTHILSFDYDVLRTTKMTPAVEYVLMLGFFIAFAVKMPIVPLHSWLPDAHAQAPTAGSVDLAGILLKTAAFGLLRYALPIFPNASQAFAPVAMILGVIGIFYGAVLACAQHDIKRLIAYTSISHMGFVVIGIYSFNLVSLQGVVIQLLAHGVSAGALFILSGEVYERLHTRDLRLMGGLWSRIAWLPAFAMFFAAASLGLPSTGNFVGEFLILLGAFKGAPVIASFATAALILAAVYSLLMMQRAFFGPAQSESVLEGLTVREVCMVLFLVVCLLGLGLYPQPVLDLTYSTMSQLVR
ncbi:MAG TPA: NADH-quinone oxidoreductase subunit M [Pseudomonadales bacterium]|nr:NADH-quinone oxidoreductase subunit M [Pseudomonadales bacterium]